MRLRSAGVVYAYAGLLVLITSLSASRGKPFYLSTLNVSNVLDQSSIIALLAIFMTLVLISGNFDLSIGSTAALGGAVALTLLDSNGPVVAILAGLGSGAAIGVVNGLLVQKVGVNAFIVTLGTMTAVRGLVLALLGGQSVTPESRFFYNISTARVAMPQWLAITIGAGLVVWAVMRARTAPPGRGRVDLMVIGLGALAGSVLIVALLAPALLTQVTSVWVMLVAVIAVAQFLRFTVPGRYLYATGANTESARLSGIRVDRYKIGVFVANGIIAATAGMLFAGKFNSMDPNSLTGTELTVLAAAILGGTSLFGGSGFVTKSVIGALILFTLANGFNVLNLGSNYQYLVQGVVLVAAATLYTVAGRKRTSTKFRVDDSASTAPAEQAMAESAPNDSRS